MPRVARVVQPTPPGMKRCKHCSPTANSFLDIRSKANECEGCRLNRKNSKARAKERAAARKAEAEARETGGTGDANIADLDTLEGVAAEPSPPPPLSAPVASTSKVGGSSRKVLPNGRRTTHHLTSVETVVIYESKEKALDALEQRAQHDDSFVFHARYVASDPPVPDDTLTEENKQTVATYLHIVNASITERTSWRFTSRGRENRPKVRKAVAIHFSCCQDANRQRRRDGPKNASPDVQQGFETFSPTTPKTGKAQGKRIPMDRFPCSGRLSLTYELDTRIVEIRMIHEFKHHAYLGRAGTATTAIQVPDASEAQSSAVHLGDNTSMPFDYGDNVPVDPQLSADIGVVMPAVSPPHGQGGAAGSQFTGQGSGHHDLTAPGDYMV